MKACDFFESGRIVGSYMVDEDLKPLADEYFVTQLKPRRWLQINAKYVLFKLRRLGASLVGSSA